MGWLIFWVGLGVAMLVMWLVPLIRPRVPRMGERPGSTEGLPSEESIRSGELGRGPGYWTGSSGGWPGL
jgi:hypothetical protein